MKDKNGFTLIELLVVLALASLIMVGIVSTYMAQQQSYLVEQERVAMHQNLRAAMFVMENEIKMAGFSEGASNGSILADSKGDYIAFTMNIYDSEANGGLGGFVIKKIEYYLDDSLDDGDTELVRRLDDAPFQAVAENIQALDFVYLDENGNPLNDANGQWDTGGGDSRALIRAIEITLVAKAGREDVNYKDNRSYKNNRGEEILEAQDDHYRRVSFTSLVQCRNLGLSRPF